MPKPSTLLLRKLSVKRKVSLHGVVHYADATPDGTIIDPHDEYVRMKNPFTLERFVPSRRPYANPPTLMAEPIQPSVWEVVECFRDLDRALPRAKQAKSEAFYKGQVLRVRDRRNGDIIMADIL